MDIDDALEKKSNHAWLPVWAGSYAKTINLQHGEFQYHYDLFNSSQNKVLFILQYK